MSSKPEQQLKVGDWWYLPEQDKLVKVDATGEITATADLDNLCQKAMNYFILNAGRLITRDEILADVWGVRDVSDGRISRVIRVLRVALGDDSREPKYIETIPKRGFRFIAPVVDVIPQPTVESHVAAENGQQTTETSVHPESNNPSPLPRRVWYRWIATISVLGCAVLYLLWQQFYLPVQEVAGVPFKRFQPLTSLKGLEVHPAMSPDGNYLVFNHTNAESHQEMILQHMQTSVLTVLVADGSSLSNAAWRPDGKALAYLKAERGKSCELRLLTLTADFNGV
ncbi:MAG: winged helix-turn-helix domain-containing protein, partial [Gammaproteobacteria bacterium]|nr:winged helix-turn-helix domain-containing protein [Gammaproteobacteria bacterium]